MFADAFDIGFIERFGTEFSSFSKDRAYLNAVSMSILQIGELANGLSDEFREQTKHNMPWDEIRGTRNWIAHAYAQIDETVIWETANHDIPKLLNFCNKALEGKELTHERLSILEPLHAEKHKEGQSAFSDKKKKHNELSR